MITFNKTIPKTENGSDYAYYEGSCLSTDTKPSSGIANGSILLEMDTGKVYQFDEEHSQWREFA